MVLLIIKYDEKKFLIFPGWFDQHYVTNANEGADEMRINKRKIVMDVGWGNDEYAQRYEYVRSRILAAPPTAGSKGVICVK